MCYAVCLNHTYYIEIFLYVNEKSLTRWWTDAIAGVSTANKARTSEGTEFRSEFRYDTVPVFIGIVVTSGAKVGHLGCSEHAIVFRFAHTSSSGVPTKAFNAAQYLRNLIHS